MQSLVDMINQVAPFIAVLQTAPDQFNKHMIKSTIISVVSAIIIGLVAGGLGTFVTVKLVSNDITWLREGLTEVKSRQHEHENNHLSGAYDDGGRGD